MMSSICSVKHSRDYHSVLVTQCSHVQICWSRKITIFRPDIESIGSFKFGITSHRFATPSSPSSAEKKNCADWCGVRVAVLVPGHEKHHHVARNTVDNNNHRIYGKANALVDRTNLNTATCLQVGKVFGSVKNRGSVSAKSIKTGHQ